MSRVYVLINVKSGTAEKVVQSLQNQSGVLLADIVERPPDIIMVVQAANQERLLKLTLNALLSVENQIDSLQLLSKLEDVYTLETPLVHRQN
jgi:hypothetical protein